MTAMDTARPRVTRIYTVRHTHAHQPHCIGMDLDGAVAACSREFDGNTVTVQGDRVYLLGVERLGMTTVNPYLREPIAVPAIRGHRGTARRSL